MSAIVRDMEKNFTFNGRKYTYNTDTKQIARVTETGATVPVSASHPSLRGILEYVEETVVTR
jgi:hypothetical protein